MKGGAILMPMNRAGRLAAACALALLAATMAPAIAREGAADAVDSAFRAFWDASTPQDAAKEVPRIVGSGVSFDDALKRLKQGRP